MASENITLYIKGDRNVEVTEQDVFLKDIVSMECSDKKFLPKLQTVKILKLHGNREQRYVVSVLEIIACISFLSLCKILFSILETCTCDIPSLFATSVCVISQK